MAVQRRHRVDESSQISELVKFGILISVFLAAILIVALTRPLIFGKIVPIVLGLDQKESLLQGDGVVPATDEAEPAPAESAPAVEDEAPAADLDEDAGSGTGAADPEAGGGFDDSAAGRQADIVEEEEPIADEEPVPASRTHVVQPGENLTQIARRYAVTVPAIIAANPDLVNPNQIEAGLELVIPESE